MGELQFVLILSFSIALLIFLILYWKVHPVLALFFSASVMGIGFGNSVIETMGLINAGFGSTLASVGLTIIFGAILAIGIQDLGATDSISNFFNKLFRGKNMELAPSLTGFIVSIPVFGDITMILMAPIASKIAYLRNISMGTMAAFTGLGLFLTHGLVPPTPGILAVSMSLGADLGLVVLWGLVVSIIVFFSTWLLLRKWTEKEFIAPLASFTGANVEGKEDVEVKSHKTLPSYLAFLPILLPVIFIASASVVGIFFDEGTTLSNIITTLGDKVIALLSGILLVMVLAYLYKANVRYSAKLNDTEVKSDTKFHIILWESWVSRGLSVALIPLLITAMGGALGGIIKANPTVEVIANDIASTNIIPLLIPYLIAFIIMTAVGSMTMAALTTAAIVAPMLPILGISPVLATLAIGAGSLALNHLSNSGFWIMAKFFNLNTKQGLKYITIPTFVGSVISIIVIYIIQLTGIV